MSFPLHPLIFYKLSLLNSYIGKLNSLIEDIWLLKNSHVLMVLKNLLKTKNRYTSHFFLLYLYRNKIYYHYIHPLQHNSTHPNLVLVNRNVNIMTNSIVIFFTWFPIGSYRRTQYITSIGLFYKKVGRLWSCV